LLGARTAAGENDGAGQGSKVKDKYSHLLLKCQEKKVLCLDFVCAGGRRLLPLLFCLNKLFEGELGAEFFDLFADFAEDVFVFDVIGDGVNPVHLVMTIALLHRQI
jgi:hypothetical protein